MTDKSDPPSGVRGLRASLFRSGPKPPREQKPAAPPPPPKRRRRRSGLGLFSALLSFVLVGAIIGLGGFTAALLEINRAGPLAEDKVVLLTREDDGGPIGDQLERAGVIDSSILFSVMTLLDGSRSGLKRGEYEVKAHSSLRDVEALLLSHKVVQHKFSVPEGLTSEQIVQRLRDEEAFTGDVKETPHEGSLLPDTYFFERGDTRSAMLARMAKAKDKLVDEVWKRRASDLPIKSPGELVTLASIVEKETGKADERPRVAGVFVNRLQKHMKLQSDPTIVYGLVFGKGTLGRPISKADLNQSTQYNTYIIDGLPPGPICNPGKAALEAAANPAKGTDLYFVADGTGGHAFASTLDQHLKNVAHWRQIEQDAKDKVAPDAGPPGAPAPITRGAVDGDNLDEFGYVPPEAVRKFDYAAFGALGADLSGAVRKTRQQAEGDDGQARQARRFSRQAAGHVRGRRSAHPSGHVVGQDDRFARRRHHRRQRRARRGNLRRSTAGDCRPGGERADVGRRARRAEGQRGQIRFRRDRLGAADAASAAADALAEPPRRQGRHLRRLRRHRARSAEEQELRPELRQERAGPQDAGRERPV